MILALRALGVGDLATAVPALRGLRGAFPHHPLALAAPTWLTPLIDLIGGVDRVVPTDDLSPRQWPGFALPGFSAPSEGPGVGSRIEVAVNLHGSGP